MGKFFGKPKFPFTKELHEYTLSLPLSLNERTLLSLSLSQVQLVAFPLTVTLLSGCQAIK